MRKTERICVVCGTEFITGSPTQFTCCVECGFQKYRCICVDCGIEFRSRYEKTERCLPCRKRHNSRKVWEKRKVLGADQVDELHRCSSCMHQDDCSKRVWDIQYLLPCQPKTPVMLAAGIDWDERSNVRSINRATSQLEIDAP